MKKKFLESNVVANVGICVVIVFLGLVECILTGLILSFPKAANLPGGAIGTGFLIAYLWATRDGWYRRKSVLWLPVGMVFGLTGWVLLGSFSVLASNCFFA